MRTVLLALLLLSISTYAQTDTRLQEYRSQAMDGERFFSVGDTYRVSQEFVVDTDLWHVIELDEGAQIDITKSGTIMTVMRYRGLLFMTSSCGYDERAGTHTGDMLSVFVKLPVSIARGSRIKVTCPPNAKVIFGY